MASPEEAIELEALCLVFLKFNYSPPRILCKLIIRLYKPRI
jgi:hypothetical protein